MNRVRKQTLLATAALLIGTGIGGCSNDANPADPNNTDNTGQNTKTAVLAGYAGPQLVYEFGEESNTLLLEAVFLASEQATGGTQLVLTGTLTQAPSGADEFTYSNTPTDKLVLAFTSGSRVEYSVTAMNGDFSGAPSDFLRRSHQLDYRVVSDTSVNMRITSARNGNAFVETFVGEFVYEQRRYQASLNSQGTSFFDIGGGFTDYEVSKTLTGSITGTAFSLTANESYSYKSIFNSSEGRFVENVIRTANTTWKSNGDSYALVDAKIRKAFLNGRPSEIDSYWSATGAVTRNGTVHAQLSHAVEGGAVKIFFQTAAERIELETWPL